MEYKYSTLGNMSFGKRISKRRPFKRGVKESGMNLRYCGRISVLVGVARKGGDQYADSRKRDQPEQRPGNWKMAEQRVRRG
jgi:hypothetical protein